MDFFQSLPLPAVIVLVALVVMYVMIDRWEAAYLNSHMGYSKDEWDAFTARNNFNPQQIQDTCDYLERDWPKDDQEWDSIVYSVTTQRLGEPS